MKRIINSFILFCLSVLPFTAYGYDIQKIGIEDGLSNNNVVSITQDRDGFIWICTKDGLNKFDANTFTVYKKSESDQNAISSNVLNYVYADPFDDVVWVATEKNGIDVYNYKTHVFTHYGHDHTGQNENSLGADGVTHITGDKMGNLWLATYWAGIDYFDKETGLFTHYNQSNVRGLGSDYNWCVMYDNDESIYIGHVRDGLSILNPGSRTAVNYKHDPIDPLSLPDNTVTCIFKDSRNNIWIGTRNGLALFDPASGRMTNFLHDPPNASSISHNFIQSIIETSDQKLWIGTEGGGVSILDLSKISDGQNSPDISFEHIQTADTPDGLSSPSVQSLIQDSFGNIWIGGLGGGLNVIQKSEPFFNKISYLPIIGNQNSLRYKAVPGLCVDHENNVWAANVSGGIGIYREGEKINQIDRIPNEPQLPIITSVLKDRDNNIWIGTVDGRIYRYNQVTNQYTPLRCFDNLRNVPLYYLFEDSERKLWICTDQGLHMYDPASDGCKIYTTLNSGLSDNVIRSVAEDANGNIWVGTLIGGLRVFDPNFELIHNYGETYDFYSVNHIYKDSKDRMWVASQNDLFLMNKNTSDSVLRIGKSAGLAESDIRAIMEGQFAEEIWLSTTNGLSHIDLNTMHVSNFNVSNDISYGDYLNGSVAKTANGRIYFGSQNGITWFNQVLQQPDHILPETVFTGFRVTDSDKNKLYEFTDIPFGDENVLKYNQNSFQVSFNVLDFSLTSKVEFVYQMEGLDDGWYLINNQKQVTFRNLKPGNYIFNLKTRIHNTEWPDEIASLQITINPPIWLSIWAKIFYILLSILILFFIVRFYTIQLKIKNSLALEKISRQKEHDLNEERIKFFTNVTHELRTPMTLILGPLEDLISDKTLPSEQTKKLNSIHRVATRLLQLINQVLELRKSTNKSRRLRVVKDDFVKFVKDTGLKYIELNKNNHVEFKLLMPEEKLEMYYDPEVVTIILDNLLSNAFKYTRNGTIKLELKNYLESNINYTEIIIADTGFGIPEADLPHIFERYYQVKNASYPVTGTGIGLALVNNMVELHEAEIGVSSQINQGTTFKVRFVTNNSYPDVIHINNGDIQSEMDELEKETQMVILVVDDNQEIIEYLLDILMDTYTVITAENGKIGYDIACEKVPDLVIADIMMPVVDGIEMCKMMKKDVRTSHIPVILLTARSSSQDKSLGYDAGADSYLTKPFSGNLLKSRLRNIFEARKRLSAEYSSKFKEKQLLFNQSISKLDKQFLEKLSSVIEENLEEEEMSISQVASQLNMSHSTLYRKIKALTNLTANEYIRKVRIHVAEQLLLTNQFTISEIMYKIGINSSSYFRQCFKDEFGLNPSEYLQKLKEEQATPG